MTGSSPLFSAQLDESAFRRALLRSVLWPAMTVLIAVTVLLALTLFLLRSGEEMEHIADVTALTGSITTVCYTLFVALMLVVLAGLLFIFGYRRFVRRVCDACDSALAATASHRDELNVTLRSIGDAVLSTDVTGTVVFLNPVAERLTGWSDSEARGRQLSEVLPIFIESTGERAENPVERVLRERTITGFTNRMVLRDRGGREIPIEDSAAPILNADGSVRGVILVFRDVSERRSRENALRKAEVRFRSVFDQQFQFMAILSPGGEVLDVNALPLRMVGTTREQIIGKKFWDTPWWRDLPDMRAEWPARLSAATQACGPILSEDRYNDAEGNVRLADCALTSVKDNEGHVEFIIAQASDITDRKRTEELMLRHQKTFFNLVEQAPFGVYVIDSQFRLFQVNSGAQAVFSNVRPLIGRDFDEVLRIIWPEPFVSEALTHFRHTLATGEPYLAPSVTSPRRDSGVVESYEWQLHRVLLPDGQFGVVCYFYDSTVLRSAEAAIRESESRFRTLADDLPMFIWMLDEKIGIVYANRAHLEFVGFRGTHEFSGGGWERIIHPDDIGQIRENYRVAARECQPFSFEIRYLQAATGLYRWYYVKGVPRYISGASAGFMGASVDIHDRKMAEQALRESEAKYRLLFDRMDEAFCVVEMIFDESGNPVDYRFLEINPAFEKHTGLVGARGKTIRELAPMHESHWFAIYGNIARTGEPVRFENRAEQLGRWFDVFAFRIGVRSPGLVAVFFSDITARKRTEEALHAAKEKAEAASRAKDNFLATLSHELRTPLTPVLMSAAALAKDERLPDDARADLDMIQRNIALEARLIDDMLDLTRIGHGKLPLREEPCNVHTLLNLAVEIVRDEAQAKGIALQLDLAARRTGLHGDPARLQQVFWNVLRNAIKFTPSGGLISIRTTDDEPGDRLCIEISDSGIGFVPEAHDMIFHPFEQAGRENDHRFGGLGLGLTIARAIVEMHGGMICAKSAGLGHGATFIVELPGAGAPPSGTAGLLDSKARTAMNGGEASLRLLLIEDHEPTLTVLSRLLTRAGHRVTTAGSVAAALEVGESGEFDLVISDLGLPDGTGLEVMSKLGATRPGLPGIALSGYGMENDLQRSREAGFIAHLIKPVDFDELRRALSEAATHISS